MTPRRDRDLPGVDRDHGGSLSEREIEVLRTLLSGDTQTEAAAKLFVSLNTIKTHLKRINDFLGTRNTVQAVAVAHELGYLPLRCKSVPNKEPLPVGQERRTRPEPKPGAAPKAAGALATPYDADAIYARFPSLNRITEAGK